MAKILLTHSYLLAFDPKQQKLGQPYAPLGTLYAAAVLKSRGYDFSFHDMMFAQGPADLVPVLSEYDPRILVIYDDCFNYLTKMCLSNMRDAAFRMITLAKERGMKVVVCSPDASDQFALFLDAGADFVIRGEGEVTLEKLIERLEENSDGPFGDIQGLAWRSPEGIRVNPPRAIMTNLDEIPFPAWELLDMEKYRNTWRRKNGYFNLNMVTTRGCPYQCIWCSKPVYANHYNSRTPRNVVTEMKDLKARYQPDGIWFADDIFGLKPGWVEEFRELVLSEDALIPYTIQTRVDLLLQESQIRPLAESGCRKAWVGIESGSQKILDAMHKGTTVQQAREASPKLREAGIEQAFFLQLGFPGETTDDIRQTIRLITDLMPDDIGISVTYPLPGTKFYDAVSEELKVKTNWTDSDDLALLYTGQFSPAFYRVLHRYIHKYFRFRQAGSYMKCLFENSSGIGKTQVRRMLLAPYYLYFAVLYRIILNFLGYARR
jgi:anaerobic magnesium-protoporphyrin IX monomethyl ester cyclase